MRILVLCHEYPPLGTGAAGALANILPRVAQMDWEVTLLTSHYGDLPRHEVSDGIAVRRIECGRKKLIAPSAKELLRFLWNGRQRAVRLAKEIEPDLILAFFTIPSGAVARYISRQNNVPYIVALRGSDVPGYDNKRFGGMLRLTRSWSRRIWRDAAAVVANSDWLRSLAIQTAPNQEIQIIPNGVDTNMFGRNCESVIESSVRRTSKCVETTARRGGQAHFAPKTPQNEPVPDRFRKSPNGERDERLRVVFVGQLVPRKGVDVLLQALANCQMATLDVVGDGPMHGELVELAKQLRIEDRVVWHGRVERQEVARHLRRAHVFAMPTQAEGMSNTVLEAMAARLPVVTTVPGAADLVQHQIHGLVIERDPESFRDAFEQLHDQTLRQQMALGAWESVQRRTWDEVASQWVHLFEATVTARLENRLQKTHAPADWKVQTAGDLRAIPTLPVNKG